MSLTDELLKLKSLHESGFLSDAELADAKKSLLEREPGPGAMQLNPLSTKALLEQNFKRELQLLNEDWKRERAKYIRYQRDGSEYIPHQWASSTGLGILTLFALAVVGYAIKEQVPGEFILPMLLGFGAFIGYCVYQLDIAQQYHDAERTFEKRRAEIYGKYREKRIQLQAPSSANDEENLRYELTLADMQALWELENAKFAFVDKDGVKHFSTRSGQIGYAGLSGGIGALITYWAYQTDSDYNLILIILIVTIVIVVGLISDYTNAWQYETARAEYQRKVQRLRRSHEKASFETREQ